MNNDYPRNRFDKLSRRGFLLSTGATLAGLTLATELPYISRISATAQKVPGGPFTLGIASGDPLPDGVVLWTRLAPDPLQGGGMPPDRSFAVEWRVAADERMSRIVQRGAVLAVPELGHSVHVEVHGLEPARTYWYQFRAGGELSPIGRTRTAPATGARLERMDFAFASCQQWQTGYFTAYRHMAEEDLDLVVHLGDYIYEGGVSAAAVRPHNSPEILTLEDYRNRYALYKSDPDLQAAHAAFPWIVTWDDHEVENNYAGDTSENIGEDKGEFLRRRATAYQAYYEHMPLRRAAIPVGSDLQLYRRLNYGDLAEFNVLDTRQYRTDQPCGDGVKPRCDEAFDPAATVLGDRQERWLQDGLAASQARWNILAQQIFFAQLDRDLTDGIGYSMDKWDGYVVARDRLLEFFADREPRNPVVLTGDIHINFVADIKADFGDPNSPVLGTEFVGTSITSAGDGTSVDSTAEWASNNPHVKFHNSQRGYVRCRLTPELWRSDYRVVPFVTTPGAPITTRASFVVEDGKAGAEPA